MKIYNRFDFYALQYKLLSQDPNPALFQTWYLRTVQSSDLSPLVNVLAVRRPYRLHSLFPIHLILQARRL